MNDKLFQQHGSANSLTCGPDLIAPKSFAPRYLHILLVQEVRMPFLTQSPNREIVRFAGNRDEEPSVILGDGGIGACDPTKRPGCLNEADLPIQGILRDLKGILRGANIPHLLTVT
jgi:hypothetical protein